MKSRRVFVGLISLSCLAWTQQMVAQSSPDPSQISIRNLQYAGTACPQNSVAANLSPDGQAFTLLFSQFVMEGASPSSNVASGCELVLNLHVPSGWSYSLFSLDYRGYANLQASSRIQTRAIYAFDGQPEVQIGTGSINGPYDDDFFLRNLTPVQSLSYSTCEGEVRPLRLSTKFNLRGIGMLQVDSFDGELVHQYGIAWRRCPTRPVTPVYRIPSQLTCFYKAFKDNNTIHGMIEYDANRGNGDKTRNGYFYQKRTTGNEQRAAGFAEAYFWITSPPWNTRQKFYLGDVVNMDPNQPIMGVLEFHVPAQAPFGNQSIRENIWDSRTPVDIRRYFGIGAPVVVRNATPGDTGYWPISLSECVQNTSASWPNH